MASSQDSEWSTDWTTSGIRILNNCPLNRGDSWIIHQAAECPISFGPSQAMLSHSDLSREQKVRAQILGTLSTSTGQSCLPQPWGSAESNGRKSSKWGCEGVEEKLTAVIILVRFVWIFWGIFIYSIRLCRLRWQSKLQSKTLRTSECIKFVLFWCWFAWWYLHRRDIWHNYILVFYTSGKQRYRKNFNNVSL